MSIFERLRGNKGEAESPEAKFRTIEAEAQVYQNIIRIIDSAEESQGGSLASNPELTRHLKSLIVDANLTIEEPWTWNGLDNLRMVARGMLRHTLQKAGASEFKEIKPKEEEIKY